MVNVFMSLSGLYINLFLVQQILKLMKHIHSQILHLGVLLPLIISVVDNTRNK